MEEPLLFVSEMNQRAWRLLRGSLDDLSDEEADWRPIPQGNSINIMVRHLRIEAEWHLDSLLHGSPMPSDVTPAMQEAIDKTRGEPALFFPENPTYPR